MRDYPFVIRTDNIELIEKITGKKLKKFDLPLIEIDRVSLEPMGPTIKNLFPKINIKN